MSVSRIAASLRTHKRLLSSFASLDARRVSLKSQWSTHRESWDDDILTFGFGAERLGDKLDVNWAIVKSHVIPKPFGDAFRNLHPRGLTMLSKGTIDSSNAIRVKSQAKKIRILRAGHEITGEEYRRIEKNARKQLSLTSPLFVQDGAVGSHPNSECLVRVMSDTAEPALFLNHTLARVRLGAARYYEQQCTGFVVNSSNDWSNVGLEFAEDEAIIAIGAKKDTFVVVNGDFNAIMEGLIAKTFNDLFTDENIPLPAHVLLTEDQKPVLVFGADKLPQDLSKVFGTRLAVWGKNYIARGWDAVSHVEPTQASRGDLIIEGSNGKDEATVTHKSIGNKIDTEAPARIIFVANKNTDNNTSSKTKKASSAGENADSAKALLLKHLETSSINPSLMDDIQSMFWRRVEELKVPVEVVAPSALEKTFC